jgi:predicted metal-dependent peptidase
MRPSKLVDIAFDTRIIQVREYGPGDAIDPTIHGGGGTSFVPIWRHTEKMDVAPKAVVILTDGEGDFGDDPGVPLIWCIYGNKGCKVPFGEAVYVE